MAKTRSLASYLKRKRWTAVEARDALVAQEASGLSLAAWAAREGFKFERLDRWRRELRNEALPGAAKTAFVEVRARPSAKSVAVVLRSGRVLRVSESIDAESLRRIVGALEDVEC
jgi:hypothetical protein